jgi:WD40 repeat protein
MIYCANKNHPIQPMYFILTILLWLIMMAGCAQSPVSQTPAETVPDPPVVKASAPPQEPILRLETGMHTTIISRIGMDAAGRYLATCSLDKTVRVWDVATGHLIRTLRPPIDQKEDGMLSAVAVSPDGRIIATGGWTGWNWGNSCSVYLFDLETGRLIHLITGIPDRITRLMFSLDSQFLSVCLKNGKGIQIYENYSGPQIPDNSIRW